MDIRQTKTSQPADTSPNFMSQKSQGDSSSLLYRMAVRTMHDDLEATTKKEAVSAQPIEAKVVSTPSVSAPIPSSLPPAAPISVPTPKSSGSIFSLSKEEKAEKEKEKIAQLQERQKQEQEKQRQKEADKKAREAEITAKETRKKEKEAERLVKEEAERQRKEKEKAATLAEKETKQKEKEKLLVSFKKAQTDYEEMAYESATENLENIIKNPQASWFLKLKANWLLKKSNRKINKKESKLIEEATKIKDKESFQKTAETIPPPMPNLPSQNITSSPPVNLPIDNLAPEQKKAEPAASSPINPLQSAVIERIQAEKAAEPAVDEIKKPLAPAPNESFSLSPSAAKILSEISPETETGRVYSPPLTRKLLLVVASLVLVLLLTGLGWWIFGSKQEEVATASPSASPIISQTPTPSQTAVQNLFTADKQKTVELKSGELLKDKLLALSSLEEEAGTIIALNLKNTQGELMGLNETANLLKTDLFDMPLQKCDAAKEECSENETLKNLLNLDDFSFFVYSQASSASSTPADSSPFTAAGSPVVNKNKGRLGLVISLRDRGNSSSTNEQILRGLKDLESLLPGELSSLLLETANLPINPNFSQTTYKNTLIRYLNLPVAELSFDYAIANKKLVIATSKISMFAILDALKGQETSQSQGEILINQ